MRGEARLHGLAKLARPKASIASRRLRAALDGTFSLYLRAYWADKAVLDGTWQPPAIEKVK